MELFPQWTQCPKGAKQPKTTTVPPPCLTSGRHGGGFVVCCSAFKKKKKIALCKSYICSHKTFFLLLWIDEHQAFQTHFCSLTKCIFTIFLLKFCERFYNCGMIHNAILLEKSSEPWTRLCMPQTTHASHLLEEVFE